MKFKLCELHWETENCTLNQKALTYLMKLRNGSVCVDLTKGQHLPGFSSTSWVSNTSTRRFWSMLMSPDSTFVSDWMRPTEHVENIKTLPKPCPSTPRYLINAEKCWPYFCRTYGTCPPWECTRGAIELWKTSKLIHAPLIIDSQHSGTAAWDPSDGTHSWCPLPLARVLTRYRALRMCRSVSRIIKH